MLFGGRTFSHQNTTIKSKSPIKPQTTSNKSPLRPQYKREEKPSGINKSQLKTKDTMGILYLLEEIYTQLNFNEFDAFAQERIVEARKNIDRLCNFFKDEPICPKHQDLFNLYCENCKEVICVSCVYKGNQEHKNHKIKPLETFEKTIEYEVIRNEEKTKSIAHQLTIIQEQILIIEKEICENYMNISNNSTNIINDTIKELQAIKEEYSNKLNLSYRRTNTIIKRYNESIDLMIKMIDQNLQKCSTMKGLSKYLLLKEVNKENALMQELIAKFNDNRIMMDQWKKSMKETQKILVKKKKQKFKKEDIYVVTEF